MLGAFIPPLAGLGASALGRLGIGALLRSSAVRFLPTFLRGLLATELPAIGSVGGFLGDVLGFSAGSALGSAAIGEPREGGFLANLAPDVASATGGTIGHAGIQALANRLKLGPLLTGIGTTAGALGGAIGADMVSRDVFSLGPDTNNTPRPPENSNDDALNQIFQRVRSLDVDEDDMFELKDAVQEAQLRMTGGF